MGAISIEKKDNLYWLGRYTERVLTTIRYFSHYFDKMIDSDEEAYIDFCRQLEIPNIYASADEFVRRYCFDEEDVNSIISNLLRGYDNAIVLREQLGSGPISYIQLAVYDIRKASKSSAPLIEFQHVIDNIMAFWGMTEDSVLDDRVRDIVMIGRRIERVDLYARLKMPQSALQNAVEKLSHRLDRSGLVYDKKKLYTLLALALQNDPDYQTILLEVENLLITE